jgi:predicted secreted protein
MSTKNDGVPVQFSADDLDQLREIAATMGVLEYLTRNANDAKDDSWAMATVALIKLTKRLTWDYYRKMEERLNQARAQHESAGPQG